MKSLLGVLFSTVVLSLVVVFSFGCASAPVVKEIQPPTGSLANFQTIAVQVSVKEGIDKKLAERFTGVLVKALNDAKLYSSVRIGQGELKDLTLKLEITKVEKGSSLARAFNLGGEGEVYLDGSLVQGKQIVATFSAKGTSQRKSQTSVGGVNITQISALADDKIGRAFDSASEGIVAYLKSKKL